MATPQKGRHQPLDSTLVNCTEGKGAGEANKAIDGRGNCWPRLTLLLVLPVPANMFTQHFSCVCACECVCVACTREHSQGSGGEGGLRQKSQQAKLQRLNGQNVLLH